MAPSRPPLCSLKVELEPPRSDRPFYTNGDLVRGQVRLEVELDPDQLADKSGQLKAEGTVQLEYGWQAKREASSLLSIRMDADLRLTVSCSVTPFLKLRTSCSLRRRRGRTAQGRHALHPRLAKARPDPLGGPSASVGSRRQAR